MELINHIECRLDRMCLERVIGVISCNDNPNLLNTNYNIFGNLSTCGYYVNNMNDVLNDENFNYKKLTLGR